MRGHESESKDRKGKGEGGRRMSLKAKQQNAPSVEDRAVETLAAFFRACFVLYNISMTIRDSSTNHKLG